MSVDVTRYLEMERAFYADLVARSNFETEAFTRTDSGELVVGSYVHHEGMDYERWLLSGVSIRPGALALEYGCGPGRMLLRLAPRFARASWGVLAAGVLLGQLGPLLQLPPWVMNLSPFTHVPRLPGGVFEAAPLLALLGVAALLTIAGLLGWQRRDVG